MASGAHVGQVSDLPAPLRTASRLLLPLCAAVALHAQPLAPLPPEILQLARIKQHAVETLTRQPNYTCLEVIERSRRDRNARKYQPADTLRLEVALVNGKEMFAWPGATQFADTDLRELIPTGAMGTGDFAQHAHTVFATSAPTFEARGRESLDGRADALRYDFRVSRLYSGYSIRIGDAQAVVGYHGSFWADPRSLDLERLDVIADDPLPPELRLVSASHRMEYARSPIGAGEFLLPASSEMVLVHADGAESRNRVQFTSCREYTGQSVVSFEELSRVEIPASAAPIEVKLPRNLSLMLGLLDEIDTSVAAVGDPVRAQFVHDLKFRGQLLFPKGTAASGRISRLERHPNYMVLGLTFFEARSPAGHALLELQFGEVLQPGPILWNRSWSADTPANPREALIPLSGSRVRLRRNLLLLWRT